MRKKKVLRRRRDTMHMRCVGELQFIAAYIEEHVNALEKVIDEEVTKSKEEHKNIIKANEKGEISREELQERLNGVLEIQNKYKGKWFTNVINSDGKPDPNGDYKKIKMELFKRLMLEAEDKWAEANKEKPLGVNMLTSDLSRCGIINDEVSKTHRPVDPYGNRTGEENVNQVLEYCISQMQFFAKGANYEM